MKTSHKAIKQEQEHQDNKKKKLVIFVLVGALLLIYIAVMVIVFLYKKRNDNSQVKYHQYSLVINNDIIDDYSSLTDGGKSFEYQTETAQIKFTTSNGAVLGVKQNNTSFVFGGEEFVTFSFHLLDNSKKIVKVEYSSIKVSNLSSTSSPISLHNEDYSTNVDKETNTYSFTYQSSELIYIYSVSLNYYTK